MNAVTRKFNNPKSIVFLTGTRADFGKMEPLARSAQEDGFAVEFFVTGMHMLKRYGLTKAEIQDHTDFKCVEFINQRDGDPLEVILAKTIGGFSDYLEEHSPDLVVVHGDRVEALAASLVCAMKYVRCAHVEGGEVSGTIDEVFRHCNTKLASHHFVSTEEAGWRVQCLGESEDVIWVIGSPELDMHARPTGITMNDVRKRYGINFNEYGIVIFHPVTSETDTIAQQAADLLGALEVSGRDFVVILPNNDPGNEDVFKAIDRLPQDRFRVLPSMRFLYFSELMRNASVIVGNSSLGVREAPFLGIPSLDVGTRQSRRGKSASISHVTADNSKAICAFLREEWGKRYPNHTLFGEGIAAEHFKKVLRDPRFWSRPLQKHFINPTDALRSWLSAG